MKVIFYVSLTRIGRKIHQTTIEKKWSKTCFDEIKNVQLLTHDDGGKPNAIGHRSD